MSKTYYSLGLMSGTSGDGVDASVIKSNGKDDYNVISDNYFKYTNEIYENIHNLREKINKPQDLKTHSKELENLEKEITLYHVDVVKKVVKNTSENIDLIGLHGQTIFHNGNKKISKQLGDGKLLSSSTKKIVVYDFRQNDMKNGGNGAPLAPIFHKQLVLQIGFDLPITIFNLGGLANATHLWTNPFSPEELVSRANDIGPGNCLIDLWIRKNSNYKFDTEGNIAKSGKIDKIILDKTFDTWIHKHDTNRRSLNNLPSLDTNDFDISFVRGLSLEDGAATLTEYTAKILAFYFNTDKFVNRKNYDFKKILTCGGGRKNNFLIESLQKKINQQVLNIDDFGANGDFVESQAFAYLAIRSFLNLPISFPETTGCRAPCTGGVIVKNY